MYYPKVPRIPIIGARIRGKHYLSRDQTRELLSDEVVIEEKLDGKTIHKDIEDYRIFGEFLKYKHTVYYDSVPSPDWFIAFDVWKDNRFLDYDEKVEVLKRVGSYCAPLIYRGVVKRPVDLIKFLYRHSDLGAERVEGIVVKNYQKQLFGKLVNPSFERTIDTSEHWMKRKREMNRLKIPVAV